MTGLGVDEHAWRRANRQQRTRFATGIVDLSPGRSPRLLDVLDGRSGRVYGDWIAEREQTWRDQVRFAALDPFRGYATALRGQLPDAVRVLDAFHVVRLGFPAVDEVRRRVQQATTGHHRPPRAPARPAVRGAPAAAPRRRRAHPARPGPTAAGAGRR